MDPIHAALRLVLVKGTSQKKMISYKLTKHFIETNLAPRKLTGLSRVDTCSIKQVEGLISPRD